MTTEGMVTHRELLADPIYRKWFVKPPKDQSTYLRWRVYVQKKQGKKWRKIDFDTWAEAYRFFQRGWKGWYNASLTCRNGEWRPPVVKYRGKVQYYHKLVWMEAHIWCGYCRRPTMTGYFTRHHAFPKKGIQPIPHDLRCGVCGMRQINLKKFY